MLSCFVFFFFQAEDGIRDLTVTGVQTVLFRSIIHGDQDAVVSYTRGVAIAEATGTPLITIAGGGHHNFGRDPVKTNLLLREFIDRIYPQSNFEEEPDGDAERAER